jgi:signal transduction histidine kinase
MLALLNQLLNTAGVPLLGDGPGPLFPLPDVLIGSAYLAVPVGLFRLARRGGAPVPRIVWLISAVLVLAGCGHLLAAATTPAPAYLLPVKILVAVLAWVGVPVVLRGLPQALALRPAAELEYEKTERKRAESELEQHKLERERAEGELEHEKAERKRAEAGLQAMNDRLESMVAQRTATASAWAEGLARSEAELKQERRNLRAVLEGMAEAVIVVDAAGRFLVFNPAARQLFGSDPGKTLADDWLARTPCYRADATTALPVEELPLTRALHGERATADLAYRSPRTGQTRWLSCSAMPLADDGGKVPGAIAVFRDVTAQKRTEQRLHDLTAYLESVREEERTRIARELHDELGQALTGLKMDLAWVRDRLTLTGTTAPATVLRDKVIGMMALADATIKTGRRIATELRPGILDDLGLVAALEWLAQDFQRRTGVPCDFTADREDLNLSRKQTTALFRIAQESLTNVTRHAQATNVQVRLRTDGGDLILEVRDNGRGLAQAPEAAESASLGLLGMRERAVHLGGTVEIRGAPAKGTQVTARIPLTDQLAAVTTGVASDGICS